MSVDGEHLTVGVGDEAEQAGVEIADSRRRPALDEQRRPLGGAVSGARRRAGRILLTAKRIALASVSSCRWCGTMPTMLAPAAALPAGASLPGAG